jgi:hypothetical protein
MELLKLPEKALGIALNVGRFVIDRMTIGGWSELEGKEANITYVNTGEKEDEE